VSNATCVFPFKFGGNTYSGCSFHDAELDEDGNPIAWCSTRTDASDAHIGGAWGNCDPTACPIPAPLCAPGCQDSWRGDGMCDHHCNNEACEYDGGDCTASANTTDSIDATETGVGIDHNHDHDHDHDQHVDDGSTDHSAEEEHRHFCMQLRNQYHVRVGTSWGMLPDAAKVQWEHFGCDTKLATMTCAVHAHADYGTEHDGHNHTAADDHAPSLCVFPFVFAGQTYSSCTYDHADQNVATGVLEPWCSTATNHLNQHVAGSWGACDLSTCEGDDRLPDPLCAPQCEPRMRGDGVCDSACDFYACGYDEGDCTGAGAGAGGYDSGSGADTEANADAAVDVLPAIDVVTSDCATTADPAIPAGSRGYAPAGSKCVFPFVFGGATYYGCTTRAGETDPATGTLVPWCSTATDHMGSHAGQWGHCDMTPGRCPMAATNAPTQAPTAATTTTTNTPTVSPTVSPTRESPCSRAVLATVATDPATGEAHSCGARINWLYAGYGNSWYGDDDGGESVPSPLTLQQARDVVATEFPAECGACHRDVLRGHCAATNPSTRETKKCVFPFVFRNITFTACTTWQNGGVPWCSTATDHVGHHIEGGGGGHWGDCDVRADTQTHTAEDTVAETTAARGLDEQRQQQGDDVHSAGYCPIEVQCSAGCYDHWRGDGMCDHHCNNEACGYDSRVVASGEFVLDCDGAGHLLSRTDDGETDWSDSETTDAPQYDGTPTPTQQPTAPTAVPSAAPTVYVPPTVAPTQQPTEAWLRGCFMWNRKAWAGEHCKAAPHHTACGCDVCTPCPRASPIPTPAPTRAPTPQPTDVPTPHPCDDGSHGCDHGAGGVCYKVYAGLREWQCGCKFGWACIAGCTQEDAASPHMCAAVTPAPTVATPAPTRRPTPVPTQMPTQPPTGGGAGKCVGTNPVTGVTDDCVFPFVFRNITFTACTTFLHGDTPWCSTQTDAAGHHIMGANMWAECDIVHSGGGGDEDDNNIAPHSPSQCPIEVQCSAGCYDHWRGDGFCDHHCNNEACGYDSRVLGPDRITLDCDNSDAAHTDDGATDQSSGDSSSDNAVPEDPNAVEGCTTKDAATGEAVTCVFPFTFLGVTYDSCTLSAAFEAGGEGGSTTLVPWCSTATDSAGEHISGHFADCSAQCPIAPRCAPHCHTSWLGDGQCDHHCDSVACGYDGGDCAGGADESGSGSGVREALCAEAWGNMVTDEELGTHSCGARVEWLRRGAGLSERAARDAVAATYPDARSGCGKCASSYSPHNEDGACPLTIPLPGASVSSDGSDGTDSVQAGVPCVFPFTYRGVEYTTCTTADAPVHPDTGAPIAWCSTSTGRDGSHNSGRGKWGACDTSSTADSGGGSKKCAVTAEPQPCSPGCGGPGREWIDDGVCDVLCLTDSCDHDGGDCAGVSHEAVSRASLCAPTCMPHWRGNGMCDHSCNNEACEYDGGDCAPAYGVDAVDDGVTDASAAVGTVKHVSGFVSATEHSKCLVGGVLVPAGWEGTCPSHPNCPHSCECTHGHLLHDETKCSGYTAPVDADVAADAPRAQGTLRPQAGGAATATTTTTTASTENQQRQKEEKPSSSPVAMIAGIAVGAAGLLLAVFGLVTRHRNRNGNGRGFSGGGGGGVRLGGGGKDGSPDLACGLSRAASGASAVVVDSSGGGFDPTADTATGRAAGSNTNNFSGKNSTRGNLALSGGLTGSHFGLPMRADAHAVLHEVKAGADGATRESSMSVSSLQQGHTPTHSAHQSAYV
jgi:hypothetical protein